MVDVSFCPIPPFDGYVVDKDELIITPECFCRVVWLAVRPLKSRIMSLTESQTEYFPSHQWIISTMIQTELGL